MAYDGQLVFDTSIDTAGFQQGTSRLGDIIKGGIIGDALRGLYHLVTEQVSAAMDRLDTFDQFAEVMTVLTGNTEKANKALSDTNDIVVGTAFGLDTAAQSVQAFVSAGMSVNKAIDTMKAWADATAFYTVGTNEDLESVSRALQRMALKGNVTMEHMQMILERGIPAIDIYADAMGVSTAEVTAQMSKGELKADDFIKVMNKAFATGTARFPAIAGAAKQAGDSWQGSIDNMKAAIARGIGSILETFDNLFNVKAGIVAFGKGIEAVLKGLAGAFQFVADNANIFIPIAVAVAAVILAMNASTIAATASMVAHTIAYWADIAVIAAYEIATNIATAAQWLFNGAVEACPLVWVIALIAIAVAGIIALTNALLFGSDTYKEYNSEVEDMAEAQDQLRESVDNSAEAFEQQTRDVLANTQYIVNLTKQLGSLYKEYRQTGQGAEALQNIISELNEMYEGLNLSLDEETGLLNQNLESVEEYLSLKAKEEQINNVQSRKNELMREEAQIQAAMDEIIEKARVIKEDDNLTDIQKIDLLAKLGEQYQDLEKDLDDNALSQKALANTSTQAMSKTERATINAFEAMSGALDNNGDDIYALAKKYDISVDDIIADIKESGDTLAEWSDKQDNIMTEGGYTLEDYAKKWGVTVNEIKAWMDENNGNLQDWNDHMEEITTDNKETVEDLAKKWGVTVQEIKQWCFENNKDIQDWADMQDDALKDWQDSVEKHQEEVINDFQELPTELDYSLDDMIKVLNENADKYNHWKDLMVQASGKLSAGTLAKLRELGPGTSKILEDIINDTSGKKAAEFESAMGKAAAAGVAGAEAEFSGAYDVGMEAVDTMGSGITNNTATAKQAAETSVVATLETMSSSVFESQSKVKTAWETIKTTILVAFRPLVGEMKSVMGDVMSGMISKMDSMAGSLYSKASSIAQNVLSRTKQAYQIHSPSKAMQDIYEMVMRGGWVGMNQEEGALYKKSDEISEGILSKFAEIPEGLATAFSSNMSSAISLTNLGLTNAHSGFGPNGLLAAAGSGNVYETNVTFNEPVNQPDVIARRISQTQRYGLAGRRN